jgi:hypothetical protein
MAGWPSGRTPTTHRPRDKTGRELGTVKWVAARIGEQLQLQVKGGLSFDEAAMACDETFSHWKRKHLTDMRERDRDEFVLHCQFRH